MGIVFKVIGGLIAVGLIWLFQLVLAAGLVVGYFFLFRWIATAVGLNLDSNTVMNVGIGVCFVLALATIFWLQHKSKRYGLEFLFSWLPV